MIPIPAMKEIIQMRKPKKRPVPSPSPQESTKTGSIMLLNTEPNQDTVMFNPKANANSFPKNHLETTTVWHTFKLSPPSPKITLPISAIVNPVSP